VTLQSGYRHEDVYKPTDASCPGDAMNDTWETDNDSDDDSLQDQLDGLTRSFLEKPPDRGEPKRPT
jgi:hypothetical protein